MTSIIPDMLTALQAEAEATPTGLATWAAQNITEARTLIQGRALEAIAVEAVCIVYLGERSDAFAELAWPVHASPMALRSEVLASPCMTDALEAKMARLRRAAEYNGKPETSEMIRAIMDECAIKYAKLGLSFGYVGNCNLFGGKGFDDRSWRVFTNLRERNGNYSVSFGGQATDNLGSLLVQAETGLDAWCQLQMKRRYDFEETYTVSNDTVAANSNSSDIAA
jgi:hypothetical protein